MGLIVDTSVFIQAERTSKSISRFIADLHKQTGETVFAISVVTLSELAHAQRRTQDPGLVLRRQIFLDAVQQAFRVRIVNAKIAIAAGLLDGQLRAEGQPVGFSDLLIAATALHHDSGVLTFNVRDFLRVPGLRVVDANQL